MRRARYNLRIEAAFRSGARLPATPPHALFGPVDWMLARVLPERIGHPFQFDTRSVPDRVTVSVELPSGLLSVAAPRKRLFSSTTYIFLLWMVGTSLVLLAAAIYFLRRQIGPIRRLADAAENFGRGLPAPALRLQGAREVRQAARAFLRMRERIRRQIAQRTEMLAGVSHDLRTPLTRMKLQLAMVADDDAARELKADVGDMERMIDGYLAFARGEGGEEAAETDLDALIESVFAGARRRGGQLSLENRAPGLRPALRANAIERALTNLVDNALRHGRTAAIAVCRRDDDVVIVLDDDGPGIPADRREDVFRPFFRLDKARNLDTGGVGLGLAIARDAVRNHGGRRGARRFAPRRSSRPRDATALAAASHGAGPGLHGELVLPAVAATDGGRPAGESERGAVRIRRLDAHVPLLLGKVEHQGRVGRDRCPQAHGRERAGVAGDGETVDVTLGNDGARGRVHGETRIHGVADAQLETADAVRPHELTHGDVADGMAAAAAGRTAAGRGDIDLAGDHVPHAVVVEGRGAYRGRAFETDVEAHRL